MLCAVAALPGGIAAAAGPGTYAFAPDDLQVTGTTGTAGAPRLTPGRTYRSSLPRDGRLHYRLDLDTTTTAYVPVTAVPPAHATVTATDGIKVSVRDPHGSPCSFASARFGAGLSPRPVTALGRREAGGGTQCQGAGTYDVLVERVETGRPAEPGPGERWDLEIKPVSEPRPARPGPTTAPRTWDSASPEPPSGAPRPRPGGAGFATARTLGQGAWRTELRPGETLFYKVPLEWGRRLNAVAELDASTNGHGYVGGALNLSLYNPVRGFVDDAALGYTGTRKSAALAPLPPVEYTNRYAVPSAQNAMRFAGDYYLALHLSERMTGIFGQGPFGVTLRVRTDGQAHDGPAYAGRPAPADVFTVTAQDRAAVAAAGTPGDGGDGSGGTAMKALAAGGIGTGTALLLALGVWTVAARRAPRPPQTRASAQKPTA
ncbi:hypothetical protein AQJ66_17325 [Streptomyces bungoensis]|uniref:Aromatic ring-opening dioxygenase LigA n=1 Tax=Streptomyces bungoensis TaxID=285568 RepID=A0A117RD15_9ACTN|nr:hypothetical protein AQJ66_17325 [Streptomyces bungoensis]